MSVDAEEIGGNWASSLGDPPPKALSKLVSLAWNYSSAILVYPTVALSRRASESMENYLNYRLSFPYCDLLLPIIMQIKC